MGRIEKAFPSPMANAMVRFLNDYHPLPGKTVVFRPLKQKTVFVNGIHAGAYLSWSDSSPTLKAYICVGTAKSPATDWEQMRRVAHEYCHALQFYRDGKVYQGLHDAELEKEAWAFAHEACAGLLKEVVKYLG